MKQFLTFFSIALVFASCSQDFTRAEDGFEYKITASGSGPTLKEGNYMEFHVAQIIELDKKDSVLSDSRIKDSMSGKIGPAIEPFNKESVPPAYFKILSKMRKGDSLTLRILNDSIMKNNPNNIPPFFKKGKYLYTTIKLVNIILDKSQADKIQQEKLLLIQKKNTEDSIKYTKIDDEILQDYFKKNNIQPLKSSKGVYIQILKKGSGPAVDTNIIASVNYTGRLMNGTMFDSNTDSSKGHMEPFDVNLTSDRSLGQGVIKGWTEGLLMLNEGSVAKFYIPSPLAYGNRQAGEDIKPNSILVFDIEVLKLKSRAEVKAALEEKMKNLQKLQQENMQLKGKKKGAAQSADTGQ